MKNSYFSLVTLLLACFVLLTSCAPVAKSDNSEASFGLLKGERIPIDDNVYTFVGKVVADVESLTRQVRPAYGSATSVNGYGSGYYVGPTIDGKSFIRVAVDKIDPRVSGESGTDILTENGVIFKFTDTKATALLPGDIIEFKCRRQYEAIAPVRDNESFDETKFATWEFDFCRLTTGIITEETP